MALGIIGTSSLLIFAQALKLADANVIMLLDFLQLILAALLGFTLFDELPDQFTLIGGLMTFGSTAYIAWKERHLVGQSRRKNN